ncbi:MAG: HD domain-containing protein [Thermoleophilia bacterium]|nr:HD domain-containing protein [Thermoleophilia bacterium]
MRDGLLGRPVRDLDVAVDGAAEPLGARLADRLGGTVFTYSERFAAVRVVAGDVVVDLSPLRSGPGSHVAADAEARLAADLAGRDFTVDALAEPVGGGEVFDPLGGRDDLAAGRLRLCAPSALDDDALRVLRLARLELEFRFAPDTEALAAARRAAAALAEVSGERLRDELTATLGLSRPSSAVRRLAELGALAVVLPELDNVRGVTQNPYHHRDVFDHTLEALDYVRGVVMQLGGTRFLATPEEVGLPGAGPTAPVAWAVLLHDVGKPVVRRVEDGRIMFWHHDEVGRGMALVVADRLRMSRRFAQFLALLIRQHLRLGFLVREQPLTRRALARYRRDVSPYVFESVVVSLCDRVATRGEKTSPTSIARHYRLARDVWSGVTKAPVPRLLSGDDVIALLGIRPGPAVGQALDALEEEVEAGDVSTVDEARSFLTRWWSRRESSPEGSETAAGPEAT